jgi:hypothetical protein
LDGLDGLVGLGGLDGLVALDGYKRRNKPQAKSKKGAHMSVRLLLIAVGFVATGAFAFCF